MADRIYAAIDLKSFYASVECVERGLDPLCTNLVVADRSRTEKTICLAVTPSLKAYGISGRARLFEVVQRVKEINRERLRKTLTRRFIGSSFDKRALDSNVDLMLDYIVAPPRMAFYMEYSTRIYNIYLRHVSPDDIHVYSIDEVFIDITDYIKKAGVSAREFTINLIREVLGETGITATAGIGTNMYLAKIAMDIVAKHIEADSDGVRIAELDERSYREALWSHKPITDFWRVGRGIAARLEKLGIYTMGDIALCSVRNSDHFPNEETLYKTFGINAELLIDHAWGYEPCRISDIKAYRPSSTGVSMGQVLQHPYPKEQAAIVVKEMADALSLDLVEKGVCTDRVEVYVNYDIASIREESDYHGKIDTDWYGRKVPASVHGYARFDPPTSSTEKIVRAVSDIFEDKVDRKLYVRRLTLSAQNLRSETEETRAAPMQLDIFSDPEESERAEADEKVHAEKEKARQKAILGIKKKFGKNAILRGMNFEEGATAAERNRQIGGHKA